MSFVNVFFVSYCESPTCFGRTVNHHQDVLKNTNKA